MRYLLLQGDASIRLRELPDESVQCVVTSPPYWGLRDYGVEGQIGLESTPEEYVLKLVEVFREVRRVLRRDGTVWLNVGDTYAGYWGDANARKQNRRSSADTNGWTNGFHMNARPPFHQAFDRLRLKPKDMVGVPWMLACALRSDGWWLRSDIIWHKPNPLPESVTDRPTKSHEYIFLLTRSDRYFYDADAVKEIAVGDAPGNLTHKGKSAYEKGDVHMRTKAGLSKVTAVSRRNRRSVWTIAVEAFSDAHFATFPTKLVEPCILAGSSEYGCCSKCGASWKRITERVHTFQSGSGRSGNMPMGKFAGSAQAESGDYDIRMGRPVLTTRTVRWQPACSCDQREDFNDGDFDIIASPVGERTDDDPTMRTGRGGMNRPRGRNEGQRPITRYEQRKYAEQIRQSLNRPEMKEEAGRAFAHYVRDDPKGARPVPGMLLEQWIERGWIKRVEAPQRAPFPVIPATVLDPFNGAGTTGLVALRLGRSYIGIELNPEYIAMSERRIREDAPLFRQGGQG